MAKGTVLVNLRRDWFAPDGSLYQVRDNPHEFPEAYAEAPKKEVQDKYPNQKYAVLPSTAEVVDSDGKTVVVVQNTGGGQQVLMPSEVQDGAKSVGGAVGEHGIEEPHQSVADAAKVATDTRLDQVGGKPRESGPLPAGTKKLK
jgi:hypothetical protein